MFGFGQLDLLLILLFIFACIGGYRLGFLARAVSWLGLILGVVVAVKLAPFVLAQASDLEPAMRAGVAMLLMLTGGLLGQIGGLLLGSRVSAGLEPGPALTFDRVVGAVAGFAGVLFVLWFMLPALANVPGWTAQQVRSSKIAQYVYEHGPEAPDTMQALRRLVGADSFPLVFEGIAPADDTGPPPESVALPADVLSRVRGSTVKVEGVACKRRQDGSGFGIAPNLIVTNAHVVAGEDRTTVLTPDGQTLPAAVVMFDAARDIALLSVPRYNPPGLPLADPKVGETGAVFGHPGGQDAINVSPAAVRKEITAVGRDLYDRQQTRRKVLILAASLRQGDSGGALVNDKGQVIGVAFAIAPDNSDTAYALHVDELEAVLSLPRNQVVDTGQCLAG